MEAQFFFVFTKLLIAVDVPHLLCLCVCVWKEDCVALCCPIEIALSWAAGSEDVAVFAEFCLFCVLGALMK